MFCQNMLEISAELAISDPDYGDMALKFSEHFLWIASSMTHLGHDTGMWDEEDGFFYDVMRLPDGQAQRLKVRSMVGLLPLCAATCYEGALLAKYPELAEKLRWFLASRPELSAAIHDPLKSGHAGRRLAAILDETKLRNALSTDFNAVADLFSARVQVDDQFIDVAGTDGQVRVKNQNSGTTFSSLGLAGIFENFGNRYLDSVSGILTIANNNLTDQINLQKDRITAFNEQLDRRRATLQAQFNATEEAIARLQSAQASLSSLSTAG